MSIKRLEIGRGAKLAFIGESGSGKSTLLELLALLSQPEQCGEFKFQPEPGGQVHDLAQQWQLNNTEQFTAWRGRHVGYIMQTGGLLPYLTVQENIELPLRLLQIPLRDTARQWASKLAISAQLGKLPAMLSVGQRQRAEVARALAHGPAILIADEPTSAVDPLNAERMVQLLCELADEFKVTLLLATHAQRLAQQFGLSLIEHRIHALDEQSHEVIIDSAVAA
ncbi:MAG: ATP-binding cassette domain-containing protein [Xanthomonadales bacterium]|nr:ATP-binding cassette domain-containing protein [Xanthomonadales bacterium]